MDSHLTVVQTGCPGVAPVPAAGAASHKVCCSSELRLMSMWASAFVKSHKFINSINDSRLSRHRERVACASIVDFILTITRHSSGVSLLRNHPKTYVWLNLDPCERSCLERRRRYRLQWAAHCPGHCALPTQSRSRVPGGIHQVHWLEAILNVEKAFARTESCVSKRSAWVSLRRVGQRWSWRWHSVNGSACEAHCTLKQDGQWR